MKTENWKRFLALPVPPNGASYARIAKAAGVTKQRVQQIEQQALRKLLRQLKHLREDYLNPGEKSSL